MQVRDALGIPDNLRAHTQTKPRNFDPEGKRSELLKYIKENDGRVVSMAKMNEKFGWSSGTAQRIAHKLMTEGRVTREELPSNFGEGRKYRYEYHTIPVPMSQRTPIPTKKKKLPKDVVVRHDPEIVAELEAKKESQIAEQRKQEHQLFVAKFRALMADFLTDTVPESSNHYDAGALARFSKWLGDKQID
jgi:hypothetical protein